MHRTRGIGGGRHTECAAQCFRLRGLSHDCGLGERARIRRCGRGRKQNSRTSELHSQTASKVVDLPDRSNWTVSASAYVVLPSLFFSWTSKSCVWRSNAGSRGENLLSQSSPLPLFLAPKLCGSRYTRSTGTEGRKLILASKNSKLSGSAKQRDLFHCWTGKSCSNLSTTFWWAGWM